MLITNTGFLDQYETYDLSDYTNRVEHYTKTGWQLKMVIRNSEGTISILHKNSVKDN